MIAGCSLLEDAGYETALKMLETNFGNRENIFGLVEKKLLNGRTARTSDELLSFACDLRSAELSLRVMRKEADFTQRMIVEIVERRLTKGMVVQWRKYALDLKEKTMSYPSFSSFVDWMEKSARGASDPFYGYSDESSMPRKSSNVYSVAVRDQSRSSEPHAHMPRAAKPHYTPSAAESRAHMPRAAEPHHMLRAAQPYGKLRAAEPHHMPRAAQPYGMLRTTAESRNMCPLCEQSNKVSSCDLFFNMNVSDRINYVQRNNIGNCLFRALSRGLFGDEESHLLIRLLTAIEIIQNRHHYDTRDEQYCDSIRDTRLMHDSYSQLFTSVTTLGGFS